MSCPSYQRDIRLRFFDFGVVSWDGPSLNVSIISDSNAASSGSSCIASTPAFDRFHRIREELLFDARATHLSLTPAILIANSNPRRFASSTESEASRFASALYAGIYQPWISYKCVISIFCTSLSPRRLIFEIASSRMAGNSHICAKRRMESHLSSRQWLIDVS